MHFAFRGLPPSRQNKKQIVAHLDPELVDALHRRRREQNITSQEIVAEAINAVFEKHGYGPALSVRRDRLVRRENALARPREGGVPKSRAGKRRVAAWFARAETDRVDELRARIGMTVDAIVDEGLRELLGIGPSGGEGTGGPSGVSDSGG